MSTDLDTAARHTAGRLNRVAPELVAPFRAALPRAATTVGRRLAGALYRENIGDARERFAGRGRRHGFDRLEVDKLDEPPTGPAELLPPGLPGGRQLAEELTDATVNLALAYARRQPPPDAGDDPDGLALAYERLAVDGHNLHPCGRTRLGWDTADTLHHDVEAGATTVVFVAVHPDLHVGDDLGATLADLYDTPAGHAVVPVHRWQRDTVLRTRYADLYADGRLRDLDGALDAAPTAAVRTLLLPPARDGHRRYLKLSLDIQVTSTRRSISTASTRNGPAISTLLHRLLADQPTVVLLAETHGAALTAGQGRDGSAILRDGLDRHLSDGETAIPGGGLTAGDTLDHLVPAGPDNALRFVSAYARLLLPPLVTLAARHGIALEAHLQNCLPTFVAGRPHRIVFRDFAGLRLHLPRLADPPTLWPGSVVATTDVDVMRAKLGYTALQAHLGEIVVRLTRSHDLDEDRAWQEIREALDEAYEPLLRDPATSAAARADHAALTARTVPHKALVRMRLAGDGDRYVAVQNPLHGP
ncbi:IucA/IucC family protein [Asanoa sp. WMMD1127]|uniref:IucA/IucC family protein n=1 Tax=Asanoa sp. WMMD1127 TaxID=3016107 RepID=UPI0024160FBB|nr:IucA/IucC family protein [Asanoa sp. WMMD1127]MDG4826062.1 IucA/IucC family protein [Asanoa sp. WMMD1127]